MIRRLVRVAEALPQLLLYETRIRVAGVRAAKAYATEVPLGELDAAPEAVLRETVSAVQRASRVARPIACLPRALTTIALLRRRGIRATLKMGVRRGDDGRIAGHAWVEALGQTVFEDRDGRYVPLELLGPNAAEK